MGSVGNASSVSGDSAEVRDSSLVSDSSSVSCESSGVLVSSSDGVNLSLSVSTEGMSPGVGTEASSVVGGSGVVGNHRCYRI